MHDDAGHRPEVPVAAQLIRHPITPGRRAAALPDHVGGTADIASMLLVAARELVLASR